MVSPPLAVAIAAAPVLQFGVGPADSAIQTRALNAGQMFALADQAQSRGKVGLAEKVYRTMLADRSAEVRAEARFRLAMIERGRGRLTEAAVLLRRVVDEQPNAQRARLELAGILARMGDEDSALRQLRALRSIDLPPNVARFVDRLTASLQAAKPFGVQVELAFAPDSNINHATRSDSLGTVFGDFTIDDEAKAKSGVGAAIRGLAHGRIGLSDSVALTSRASVDASLYRHKDFNDISVELAAGPEWRAGRTRLSVEAAAGQQWYGMKPFQRSFRMAAAAVAPIGSLSQLRLDVAGRQVDNRFNGLEDGRGYSAQARFERALSPRLLLSASLAADRFHARDAAYSTKAWQAGIAAYREVGSVTVSAELTVGRLKADERLQLLPEARSDRLRRIAFGTVFRRLSLAGFAPVTRLVIERNRSTVEFYDYKRVRTEFGISRAF